MNPGTKTALAVAAGTVGAAIYIGVANKHRDPDTGREYLSPWTVDIAAWGAGATLIWLGYRHQSFLITFMGATVAALSIARLVSTKVPMRPTADELMNGKFPIGDRDTVEHASLMKAIEIEDLL